MQKELKKISDLVNVIYDLIKLAKTHKIEGKLYYGDGIYAIYKIIGDTKVTKFLEKTWDDELKREELWKVFVQFMDI